MDSSVNQIISEVHANLDKIDGLAQMFFEGMNSGWLAADRRGRQDGYRNQIRNVAKAVQGSKKRCAKQLRHEPLANYFRKLLVTLREMEKAPFPEDYYPQVMACGSDGFHVCFQLVAQLAHDAGKEVSTVQRVRAQEWEEKSKRALRVANASVLHWRSARVRNAFARVSSFTAHDVDGDISKLVDCWLDLHDALRSAGLQEQLSRVACHDTPECQLASSLLIDFASTGRREALHNTLDTAHRERWTAYENIYRGLEHLGRNAFGLLDELAAAQVPPLEPSGEGLPSSSDAVADDAHLRDVAKQVVLLASGEREILMALYERRVFKESSECPSQEILASWLGYDCNTSLKNTLACLVKTLLVGNWSHEGKRGGYYLTDRGQIAARLIEADQS